VAERCWITDAIDRPIGQLSKGYRQRVGLADTLLHNPRVLILDEPTIGLDPAQIRAMRELIRGLGMEHTVVLSSHILNEVEQTCDELIIIAGGRIAATGTPAELRRRVVRPSAVVVELKGDEPAALAAKTRQIPGVRSVADERHGNWVRLTISGEAGADLRVEVYKFASQNGYELRELRSVVGSLEDFFVQVTYEQDQRMQKLEAS
ncbi:MAG: ATP-binding cassette domain-containing protein, partial [Phycisphaerae bacterium]|nr:ATP-binding cassette domain-containing protein [Phycisphaerae bacterium]